jgi:hypothetical protein
MMTDLNAEEAERRIEKKKLARKKKAGEKWPKLTVLSVNGTDVECQLETGKIKTVTFKFDCEDLVPVDVAKNLVAENLLSESHLEMFVEMVEDCMHQVREKPGQIPVLRHPLDKQGGGVGTGGVVVGVIGIPGQEGLSAGGIITDSGDVNAFKVRELQEGFLFFSVEYGRVN